MSGIPRREIEESFRLAARREWWLPVELLVGVLGYVAWVSVTWSVAADLVGVGDQPAGEPALDGAALGLFAVLWLLVPAVVGVARLRSRTLNFRGNLEREYRFERPGTLLAPPVVVVYVALLAWIVVGGFSWQVYVVLVAATTYLVLRTLAYSYRVFAFSHPSLVHVIALITFALQTAAALAIMAGQWSSGSSSPAVVVEALATATGLSWALGTTTVGGMATPIAPALAVAVPAALVVAFLLAQSGAAFMVRVIEPDVTPADIRGGQRYPPAVRTADGAGPTPQSTVYRSPKSPGPSGGSASSSNTGRSRNRRSNGNAGAGSDGTSNASSAADAGTDDAEDDDTVDDVSHTRVFTPPDGPGDGAVAGVDDAPDGTARNEGNCPACGQQFAVDTEVRFCPNCGEELD